MQKPNTIVYHCSTIMNKTKLTLIVLIINVFNHSQAQDTLVMKSLKDSFSYAFGASVGSFLHEQQVNDINWEVFNASLASSIKYGDSALLIKKDLLNSVFDSYIDQIAYNNSNAQNKAFFEAKKKEGYQETSSGLLYKVEQAGNGKRPTSKDTVLVYYSGSFIDGFVFDSNIGREPMKTGLESGLIKGFIEAVLLMDEGSTYEFVIPYQLAYGKDGQINPYTNERMIKPYQTLVFQIKLKKIKKPTAGKR